MSKIFLLLLNIRNYGDEMSLKNDTFIKNQILHKVNNQYFYIFITSSILSLLANNTLSKEDPVFMNLNIGFMVICHIVWKFILKKNFLHFQVNYMYFFISVIFQTLIPLIIYKNFFENKKHDPNKINLPIRYILFAPIFINLIGVGFDNFILEYIYEKKSKLTIKKNIKKNKKETSINL
jgi:hypothetical protein